MGRTGTVVAVVIVALLAGCSGGPGTVTTSFDERAEGWTVVGDAQSGAVEPTHAPEGGSPGGHLTATDDVTGGVWYWNASAAYLGDVSAYAGGTLAFDLTQSATDSQFDAVDVVLVSGDTRIGYDFGNTSTHPGTEWTHYEVPLTAAGWTVVETAEPATDEQFRDVLADLDAVRIRGEYRTGGDTGGLDTVELSPAD